MAAMPRPRPPHLHRQVTRHGKTVWYVRVGKGPRVRIRAEFGTPEFDSEYQAAVSGALRPRIKGAPSAGTLAWLIARYRETTSWAALSAATRRQRENIFLRVIETAGDNPFAKIDTTVIMAGRERRAGTPAQARNFLDAMRGLFRWALAAKLVKSDPTAGVNNPPRKAGDGFIPWTEEHVAQYQRRWPLGTRQRVWLDVLLYSGLRRGDAVRYGRQHVTNGIGRIKTEKSGGTVTAVVPMLPILAETLDAGPCGDLTFIVGENGKRLTKEVSVMPSGKLVAPLAFRAPRMACGRSQRRLPLTTVRPLRSSRPCLDGPAMRCRRSTPEPLTASASAERRATCWRTLVEHLFPHLSAR
jgi:integrase